MPEIVRFRAIVLYLSIKQTNMTNLNIKRQNTQTGTKSEMEVVFNQTLTPETIDQLHWIICTNHPDDHVNFNHERGFLYGQPINMKLDETLVDKGIMSFEQYLAKWYPGQDANSAILAEADRLNTLLANSAR